MRGQLGGQAHRVPVGDEALVDVTHADPRTPLSQPQRPRCPGAIQRADVGQILLHCFDRPRHHRGHVAPTGRAAPHRLAPAHRQHPEPAQLGSGRVGREVRSVEHRCLPAAQPPGVGDLEHCRVPPRRQPALAAMRPGRGDAVIGVLEECLQLIAGERPPSRVALVVGDMIGGVPVMADLRRVLAEAFLALQRPTVTAVAGEVAEHRHRVLIGPDRGPRPTGRTQRHRPLLDVGRAPPPRVLAGEPPGTGATSCPGYPPSAPPTTGSPAADASPPKSPRTPTAPGATTPHRRPAPDVPNRPSHPIRSQAFRLSARPDAGCHIVASNATAAADTRTGQGQQPPECEPSRLHAETPIPYGCSILKHAE
jgi:hypothetical protein